MDTEFLRHTVATLAYRAAKVLREAPAGFTAFQNEPTARTPGQILAHMGDLFDWALSMARGTQRWQDSAPLEWEAEQQRFFAALSAFDAHLASGSTIAVSCERLFQGPIADALTHTGQIALLRRMAGSPVKAENYSRARIAAGQTGSQQPAAVQEFGD